MLMNEIAAFISILVKNYSRRSPTFQRSQFEHFKLLSAVDGWSAPPLNWPYSAILQYSAVFQFNIEEIDEEIFGVTAHSDAT